MMKNFSIALAILLLPLCLFAQQQPSTGSINTSTTGVVGNCVNYRAQNNSTVGIIITGTWTGTITPSLYIFPARPINKKVLPVDGATAQSTITSNGGYVANVGGFVEFQLCATAWVSGTAVVDIFSTPAPNNSTIAGGGGAGSGTVNSGTTPQIAYYPSNGTAVSSDPGLTDNQTTLAYAGTGGITASKLGATGAGAGLDYLTQGADQSANCPVNSDCSEAPATIATSFTRVGEAAGPSALSVEEYGTLASGKTVKTFNTIVGTDTSVPSAPNTASWNTGTIACGDANGGITSCTAPFPWSCQFTSATSSTATNCQFTAPVGITITQMDLFTGVQGAGCTTAPVMVLWDNTSAAQIGSYAITLTNATASFNVTGSTALTSGHKLSVRVTTAGAGCTTNASGVQVTATFHAT